MLSVIFVRERARLWSNHTSLLTNDESLLPLFVKATIFSRLGVLSKKGGLGGRKKSCNLPLCFFFIRRKKKGTFEEETKHPAKVLIL